MLYAKRLIDLIIPSMLIITCCVLLLCGIDGEVKSILTLSAGWAFRASLVQRCS